MPSLQQLHVLAQREARGVPVDPDAVAGAMLTTAAVAARSARTVHAETAAQVAAAALYRDWAAGRRTLDQIAGILPTAVLNVARNQHRADGRRPATTLELCGEPTSGELTPERRCELLAELDDLRRDLRALEDDLAGRRQLDRLVEGLAARGLRRAQIAEEARLHGHSVSEAQVRKIVSRLQQRYPALRERWANRAADGAGGRPVRVQVTATRSMEAALSGQPALVRCIHVVRLRHSRDPRRFETLLSWGDIAAYVQQDLGVHVTSTRARDAWRGFVATLPPALRRAAP